MEVDGSAAAELRHCAIRGTSSAGLLAAGEAMAEGTALVMEETGGNGVVDGRTARVVLTDTHLTKVGGSGVVVAERAALTLARCDIGHAAGAGVEVAGGGQARLTDCQPHDLTGDGIRVAGSSAFGPAWWPLLRPERSVTAPAGVPGDAGGVLVERCTITRSGATGVAPGGFGQLHLTGSTVDHVGGQGVLAADDSRLAKAGSQIRGAGHRRTHPALHHVSVTVSAPDSWRDRQAFMRLTGDGLRGLPRSRRMSHRKISAALVTLAVTSAGLIPGTAASAHGNRSLFWDRQATYPVYQNGPAVPATAAEISAVTDDGRTLIYTDALAKRIGFVDIGNARKPKGLGTLGVNGEPTSVTVRGDYALVVVDTSESFTNPSGVLQVVRIKDRKVVRTIDLGGQPDSIALSKGNKRYAAIAIENQRDEGVNNGDLPQAPAGFVQIVDFPSDNPAKWSVRKVTLPAQTLAQAGIVAPEDPEPEYVSINEKGKLVVTLQENNGIVVIDLRSGKVEKAFSAGTATVKGIDVKKDGKIDLTGQITDVPREPDSIAWVDDRYVATANEGDWKGGTRGWTVFDTQTGRVVWDAGNTFERLAVTYGLHNEDRAGKKGTEPEGLAIATFHGTRYAFVGSERSNFVAVYDLSNPARPVFKQVLPTTNGPEGLLPIPGRDMLAVSSEVDDASVNVRSSVSLFALGRDEPGFPSIVSRDDIGWGALGALSAVPGKPSKLYSVTDSAYTPTRLLTIDTSGKPAEITSALTVTDAAGAPVGYDAEGIYARPQGGFWLGVEGATGDANKLVRLDATGRTVETVSLPSEVAAGLSKWGIEGVTGSGKYLWVALQRELSTDPKGVARIGRYDTVSKQWTWYGYQLETTTTAGDWIGLSEIVAVDEHTLAVIERDKLNGPNAKIKRVYTVTVPAQDPAAGTLPVLRKRLAIDVLPALRADNGWTQEKLEGLTIGGDGQVYAITDNDAVKDATGETVFLRLGPARKVF
ncbi:esterase-like activity of phytase family protein [Dactylosporangium sp. CA-233914]|uniref:esterase-like activity of phytase family protein n=1 Tax=Dactylosporangium sp. CA-233914 TaxID=3239934 RepID=UPI003D8E17F4